MSFFARINGDENDECMELLRQMNVTKVPIFLFIRDYKIRGRYVGSGRGELTVEIIRYQGVRVRVIDNSTIDCLIVDNFKFN